MNGDISWLAPLFLFAAYADNGRTAEEVKSMAKKMKENNQEAVKLMLADLVETLGK